MRNQKSLKIAIDILLASSWGLSFFGFFIGFYLFLPFGFLSGVCGAIFLAIPGLFVIVGIELFFIQKEKLHELKSQTKLLKLIQRKLSS